MSDLGLTLRITPARRHFKTRAGQNNHFLITLLVGLDGIRNENIDISPEFSTSWSPKDRLISYHRSRQYALESSLVWITDLIDGYRKSVTKIPGLFSAEKTHSLNFNDSGRAEKLGVLTKELSQPMTAAELIVRAAFTWRNRVVHGGATSKVDSDIRSKLEEKSNEIRENYRGLDISRFLESIESLSTPTFKETASTINAAHKVVETIDLSVVQSTDLDDYAGSVLECYFQTKIEENDLQVFSRFWPNNREKTRTRLRQLLLQNGMSPAESDSNELSDLWVDELLGLTAHEARSRFASNR